MVDKKYNFIYRELVQNWDDIVGHVAYSLYKENKIQFIEKFKKDHGGKEPTDEDFENFHRISCLPDSIENYKRSAVELLKSFMNALLADEVKEIEASTFRRHEEMLRQIVEKMKSHRKSWWKELGMSALSTFIIMVIIAFIPLLFPCPIKVFRLSSSLMAASTWNGRNRLHRNKAVCLTWNPLL